MLDQPESVFAQIYEPDANHRAARKPSASKTTQRDAAARGGIVHPIFAALSLRALPITLTEDRAMAAAAMIGDSSRPKTG